MVIVRRKFRPVNEIETRPKHCGGRKNIMLTIGHKTMSLTAWCEETGVSKETARRRLKSGLSPEAVFSLQTEKPPLANDTVILTRHNGVVSIVHNGIEVSINEISKVLNVKPVTILSRILRGWTIEAAITTRLGSVPTKEIVNHGISIEELPF